MGTPDPATWRYAAYEWLDALCLQVVATELRRITRGVWGARRVERLLRDDRVAPDVEPVLWAAVAESLAWTQEERKRQRYGFTSARVMSRNNMTAFVSIPLAADWHCDVVDDLTASGFERTAVRARLMDRFEALRHRSISGPIDGPTRSAFVDGHVRGLDAGQAADDIIDLVLAACVEPTHSSEFLYHVTDVADARCLTDGFGVIRARDRDHALHLLQRKWCGPPNGSETVRVRMWRLAPPSASYGMLTTGRAEGDFVVPVDKPNVIGDPTEVPATSLTTPDARSTGASKRARSRRIKTVVIEH